MAKINCGTNAAGLAVFGGIGKGKQGEPPGVRLGDLMILE